MRISDEECDACFMGVDKGGPPNASSRVANKGSELRLQV